MTSIRIYSPHLPIPATEGAFQVIEDQARALRQLGYEVELAVWKDSPADVARRLQSAGSAGWDRRIRTLNLPSPASHSRVLRVMTSLASGLSSPELHYYPPTERSGLQTADLGIYHYSFAYPWLAGGQPAERRRAVVFHNLESELFEQRARAERNPVFAAIHRLNARKLRAHEAALARLADELWFISPEDRARFIPARGARARLRYVSPGFPPALREARHRAFQARRAPGKERVILGFIGALDFLPNLESALWLTRELAPRLQSRGFAGEIHIAGRGAPRELMESAARFPFVKVLGFLPDAEEFWSSLSFSAVPHFSGSGVRMKLLESLASGIPLLATPGAAARIDPTLARGPGIRISERAEEWAEWLGSQRAYEEREKLSASPFPAALDSAQSYGFLNELLG